MMMMLMHVGSLETIFVVALCTAVQLQRCQRATLHAVSQLVLWGFALSCRMTQERLRHVWCVCSPWTVPAQQNQPRCE
jgi:hypothetical protein